MNRHIQVQTYTSPSLSLCVVLMESSFSPTYTCCLSAERLKCHIAGWLDSDRPAGRKEMRWKDGLAKPVCSRYFMQAQEKAALYGVLNAAHFVNVFVNLGQLQTILCLQQLNIALTYLLIWSAALTFLRLSVSSFCSHLSFYLSISLTSWTLWERLLHPLPNVTTLKLSSDVSYY